MMDRLLHSAQLASGCGARYAGAEVSDFPHGSVPPLLEPTSVFIGGDNHTGKTHLACAYLGQWAVLGHRCLFLTAHEAIDAVTGENVPEMATVEALVIDDVTALHIDNKGYVASVLTRILNQRYSNNLHTIVTSNWPISRWAKEQGALWRIFKGMVLVELRVPKGG